jgi:hypothetical protein
VGRQRRRRGALRGTAGRGRKADDEQRDPEQSSRCRNPAFARRSSVAPRSHSGARSPAVGVVRTPSTVPRRYRMLIGYVPATSGTDPNDGPAGRRPSAVQRLSRPKQGYGRRRRYGTDGRVSGHRDDSRGESCARPPGSSRGR